MGFFTKIYRFFIPRRPASRYHPFQVKCSRCGETLSARLDTYNDPSLDYENGKPVYFCRKVLIGSGLCHQPVETTFKLDESHHILEQHISGGEFIG